MNKFQSSKISFVVACCRLEQSVNLEKKNSTDSLVKGENSLAVPVVHCQQLSEMQLTFNLFALSLFLLSPCVLCVLILRTVAGALWVADATLLNKNFGLRSKSYLPTPQNVTKKSQVLL